MIAAGLAWLKGWLSARQARRSHRVTTITRTVTREAGQPEQEQVESREVVEETLPIQPPPPLHDTALHVSVAVTSVAGVVAGAFLLGWLIRRMRG